jgi:hypothetical protein
MGMSVRNMLRVGRFEQTTALIVYRRRINWGGHGHLKVIIAQGLFISQIKLLPGDMFDLVHSYQLGYNLDLVLEPRHGTPEHDRYERWERGGAARNFFQSVRCLRGGHAFLAPPREPLGPIGSTNPQIGEGGSVLTGHPYVVELGDVGRCVWQSLAALGVTGSDQRTIAACIITQLGERRREAGF